MKWLFLMFGLAGLAIMFFGLVNGINTREVGAAGILGGLLVVVALSGK